VKPSTTLLRIWACFLQSPSDERYGFELIRETESSPGALYPRLRQMVASGYLTQREDHEAGRMYYRITTSGYLAGVDALRPFQLAPLSPAAPAPATPAPAAPVVAISATPVAVVTPSGP
jgi:hypothetical protein